MINFRSDFFVMTKPFNARLGDRGFTLVELMIACAIGSIVMGGALIFFNSQNRYYVSQNEVVVMQQNAKIAMDMITRDIRSAGYDPNNLGAGITVAGLNTLSFTREDDLPANGLETLTYSLFDAFATTAPPGNDGLVDDLALQITLAGGGSAGRQVVAENISRLEFRYLDKDGIVTADLADIRSIQVSILAVVNYHNSFDDIFFNNMTYTSASGTVWGPFNDSLRRRLLITTIQCRNLGL